MLSPEIFEFQGILHMFNSILYLLVRRFGFALMYFPLESFIHVRLVIKNASAGVEPQRLVRGRRGEERHGRVPHGHG